MVLVIPVLQEEYTIPCIITILQSVNMHIQYIYNFTLSLKLHYTYVGHLRQLQSGLAWQYIASVPD